MEFNNLSFDARYCFEKINDPEVLKRLIILINGNPCFLDNIEKDQLLHLSSEIHKKLKRLDEDQKSEANEVLAKIEERSGQSPQTEQEGESQESEINNDDSTDTDDIDSAFLSLPKDQKRKMLTKLGVNYRKENE